MPAATFDTLKFANTLKNAGVPSAQAEAQAIAFAEVIQINLKDLVTKDDLSHSTLALKNDLSQSSLALKEDLDRSVQGLKEDLNRAVVELKRDHRELEQRLSAKMDTRDAKQHGESVLVRWMLGVVLTALLGILIRLFVFRGAF